MKQCSVGGKRIWQPSEVLLHRGEMLFIDRIDDYGEDWLKCSVLHERRNVFSNEQGRVPAWVGVEYMAQAVAALEGINRLNQDESVLMSLIIGSRKVTSTASWFHLHQELNIDVECEIRDSVSLGAYACKLSHEGTTLMTAILKGAMPEDCQSIFQR